MPAELRGHHYDGALAWREGVAASVTSRIARLLSVLVKSDMYPAAGYSPERTPLQGTLPGLGKVEAAGMRGRGGEANHSLPFCLLFFFSPPRSAHLFDIKGQSQIT